MATKKLPRFDDGGYVDDLSPIDTSWADKYYQYDNSGPSASDISALTNNATTGANSIQAQVGSNPAAAMDNPAGTSSGSSGALSKVLSNLGLGGGNTSNTAALNAAVGLLSAYGKYKSNAAGTKLPNMPALGALPTLPGSNTAGYGPAGGYGYQNYAGAGGAGKGYAPTTPATPPPSYFTYGSGPEHQFFQQVTGKGGPIAPVTMAQGGSVPGFDMGGMVPNMGARPMSGMPGARPQMMIPQAPQPAMQPPRPPMPQGAPPAPMGAPQPRPPSTMMQRMQAAKPVPGQAPGLPRPFAHGGATGALSAAMNPGISRHVTGPGDGTSDSIPARLANGEYVIDAQAVSMLGNGDNSAGAKRLDEFRKNLRAHKGSALAKGKMAPDAKPLHKYMGGQ